MERQRADQALRVSDDFNRRIIEDAPCGIVQVSLEGAILKANSVAQKVLGLTFDELSRRFVAGFESETFWEDGSVCAAQDHPVSKCLPLTNPSLRPPSVCAERTGGSHGEFSPPSRCQILKPIR